MVLLGRSCLFQVFATAINAKADDRKRRRREREREAEGTGGNLTSLLAHFVPFFFFFFFLLCDFWSPRPYRRLKFLERSLRN